MKKYLLLIIACLLLVGCGSKNENEVLPPEDDTKIITLFEHEKYKDLALDNIDYCEVIRFTVAGDMRKTISETEEIATLYNELKNVKIGKETNRACEDNTTVYRFVLKDGTATSVEFECDWVIIGTKRYEIVKNN